MNTTRKLKGLVILGTAVVGLTAFGHNVSAASPQWNPQSTNEPVSAVSGNAPTFKDNKNNTVSCTTVTAHAEAPVGGNAAEAQTTNTATPPAATPPAFSSCSSNIAFSTASVSCSTAWDATVTSVNSTGGLVDVSNVACTISITVFGATCTITAGTSSSPVTVTGNTFTNSTSQLAANSASTFNISESGFGCDGATTASESGAVQIGATAGSVTVS